MINVVLNQTSIQPHTSVIIVGLKKLQEKKLINLSINDLQSTCGSCKNYGITVLEINGKNVVIDVADGYGDTTEYKINLAKNCDYYFRRSFNKELNIKYYGKDLSKKIYPLGMNYYCYYKGEKFDFSRQSTIKKIIRQFMGFKSEKWFTIDKLEYEPSFKQNPKIIFFCRLWEPQEDEYKEHFETISKMRIEVMRKLKNKYQKSFVGGVFKDSYSLKMCPDLVVSKKYTKRDAYLKQLKKADICIGSLGLGNSTGWKTAEYVIASKAIVMEQPVYDVPGKFCDGENYLSFKTADECLEKVDFLINNPDKIIKMEQKNRDYYLNYLSPDAQMKYVIETVLNER